MILYQYAIESLSHQLSQCQRTSYQNSDGQLLRDINMAASIGEPVVFADDIKDPNILNVATCGTEGSVIVTQNPNLINIYKVQRKMTTSVN